MSTLSSTVSLTYFTGPSFDQQQQNSCEAVAICGEIQMQMLQAHHAVAPLSAQFLYNDTRIIMQTFPNDSGSTDYAAYRSTMLHGIANQSSFNYGIGNEYIMPSSGVYAEAATQKVLSYTNISIYQNYSDLVKATATYLTQGKGVLISMVDQLLADGSRINGAHKVFVDKVDYTTGTVDFQNSWGPTWNGNGHGQIKFVDFHPTGAAGVVALDVVNGFKGLDFTFTPNKTTVSQIFGAALDRAAESNAIKWYSGLLDGGLTVTNAANGVFASAEAQSTFGSLTHIQAADLIFSRVVGRTADAGAEAYFSGLLDAGYGYGDIAVNMLNAVWNGYDTPTSHDRLHNRAAMSDLYGITYAADDFHHNAAVASLVGITDDANTVEAHKIVVWNMLS